MATPIQPADLHPGDVLLYHGDSFLSKLIRLFDGTEYSHSSIWTGQEVVEALGSGVVGRALKESVADSTYVDVYRFFNKDTGQSLGDDQSPLPSRPVLDQAAAFKKDKDRYAYEEILLLALLASTRQITSPIPLLGFILRNILDHAADVLARLASQGKEPLICSELVYRCFSQAGPAYQIRIRGADMAFAAASYMAGGTFAAAPDGTGYQEAAAAFLSNYRAVKALPRVRAANAMLLAAAPAAAPVPVPEPFPGPAPMAAVADFVTPGDLKKSPDLQRIGTLKA